MKSQIVLALSFIFFITIFILFATETSNAQQVILTSGSSWTVPSNVSSITVECWGGGGGGGGVAYPNATSNCSAGGGGGGGAYAKAILSVNPGSTYNYTIGAGGSGGGSGANNGSIGGTTTFNTNSVVAVGGGFGGKGNNGAAGPLLGVAGSGGSSALCTGDIKWSGGNGAAGFGTLTACVSGAGGGGAGTNSNGNSAVNNIAGAASGNGGGSGGAGCVSSSSTANNGQTGIVGFTYGGGGSGGRFCKYTSIGTSNKAGGAGASGVIIISWSTCITPTSFNVTGGGVYCLGGAGQEVGLNGSQIGVNYQLYAGGTNPIGVAIAGTGSAISFGNQTIAETYTVQTTSGGSFCEATMAGDAIVTQLSTPAPTGNAIQVFLNVATVADLAALGSNLNWYDAASGGNLLPSSTLLVDGQNYYASQTLSLCESQSRFGVTAIIILIKTVNLHLYLEGLFDASTNTMFEAKDGNTGMPQWGYGIADRVQVDLFAENPPYAPIGVSISGIDLTTAGLATFQVSPTWSGNYYIRVRNRNHLETWSAVAVPFNTSNVDYNFQTGLYQAYGSNPQMLVSSTPALYAFYLGDLDQGGWIDAIDFNMFEPELTMGTTGFTNADFDGGGWVDAIDFNMFEPRLTYGNSTEYPGKK